jgi:hypothetical protein
MLLLCYVIAVFVCVFAYVVIIIVGFCIVYGELMMFLCVFLCMFVLLLFCYAGQCAVTRLSVEVGLRGFLGFLGFPSSFLPFFIFFPSKIFFFRS